MHKILSEYLELYTAKLYLKWLWTNKTQPIKKNHIPQPNQNDMCNFNDRKLQFLQKGMIINLT